MKIKICPNCHNSVAENNNFCPNCNADLTYVSAQDILGQPNQYMEQPYNAISQNNISNAVQVITKKRTKKPLIIGIIAGVAVIAVALIVVFKFIFGGEVTNIGVTLEEYCKANDKEISKFEKGFGTYTYQGWGNEDGRSRIIAKTKSKTDPIESLTIVIDLNADFMSSFKEGGENIVMVMACTTCASLMKGLNINTDLMSVAYMLYSAAEEDLTDGQVHECGFFDAKIPLKVTMDCKDDEMYFIITQFTGF